MADSQEAIATAALARVQKDAEGALERWLPRPDEPPAKLHEAMRYSVLGGGKRVRPTLCVLVSLKVFSQEKLKTPSCFRH